MTERPILFTPENAQKCHEGTKTQTRRIIKPQPISISWFEHQNGWCARVREDTGSAESPAYVMVPCPYGIVGDRMWVRETWAKRGEMQSAIFKAEEKRAIGAYGCVKWKPSIHMPKWACRTWLEITEIRVQRLQEISEDDCYAEGLQRGMVDDRSDAMQSWYRELWESINGPGSWATNPWVWAITFRKVQP